MSIGALLLIILVVFLIGGISPYGTRGGAPYYGLGYGMGGGGLGLILVIVLILVLLGRF